MWANASNVSPIVSIFNVDQLVVGTLKSDSYIKFCDEFKFMGSDLSLTVKQNFRMPSQTLGKAGVMSESLWLLMS